MDEPGVVLYQEPGFRGASRRLDDTGLTAWSPAALGLAAVGSVRITPGGQVFRAQLYDCAPVYLPPVEETRVHRLDVTGDLADTGDWAARTRYVTVAACAAGDADWGFGRVLAAGEPARYTLVERPPSR
ncbi:hypothetical protein [Streptacidiphilus melanogenes]|uniref:hypothetical protein n=1 Tax=Streptacidiphilus melanogenes TaxID=411235 RepID=UPI0005A957D3|nr:hypothetical protein [Streptacidiphilus melanogenes]